jgi:hypothetical protein
MSLEARRDAKVAVAKVSVSQCELAVEEASWSV